MELPIYQLDVFTSRLFGGNPAAVCPLSSWLDDATLQAIAAENNLAETAFFVPDAGSYQLRWFTPTVEVDLCGHATMASAAVLWRNLGCTAAELRFNTRSGELRVTREGDLYALDFPARPPQPCDAEPELLAGLGGPVPQVLASRDYFCVYESEDQVRALKPDMGLLSKTRKFGIIVTAPGDNCDFVSRFFAPNQGVPEDPATGSAHCTLIPYWAARLGKKSLRGLQVSWRVGEFFCKDRGDRVSIGGDVVPYLEGKITVQSAARGANTAR